MLEVGEMLAAPALEDLIPARHEVGDRAGPEGCGCRKQLGSLKEQKAVILMPPDFPLARAKRIRRNCLDDCTAGGTEVKSRLVATEVAYCSRDECFAGAPPKALRLEVSVAASRGRRLAYFDVVAAFVRAPIDELAIFLWPRGLGQGHTAVLHKALYGTRQASRLWQRFLREVLDDAVWKASVIFASMYTLGDKRGTRGDRRAPGEGRGEGPRGGGGEET